MAKASSDPTDKKEGSSISSILLLGRFINNQRPVFMMATLLLILEAFTAVQLPLLTAFVVNYLTRRLEQLRGIPVLPPKSPLTLLGLPTLIHPDVDTILVITIGFIALTMINSLADSLAEIYLARGGRRLGYNLRVGLYGHLQKLSLAFHDHRRTGDVLTRVTSDVAALEDFIISSLSDFVGSVLLIVFILYVMVKEAWQVAVLAAVIIPIMALISNYFTKRIKAASKKLRTSEGELASAAQEMLTSIRVIQTYGQGSYEQGMFADQSQKAMDAALESAGLQARFSWIVSVLGAVSTAAVIWMGVWLIFRDPITADIGMLTAFIAYIKDMFKPTKRIIQEWNTLAKLHASLERIADLLGRKPAVQDSPSAVDAPPLKGDLEFKNVSFAYQAGPDSSGNGSKEPPRMILKNISFKASAGEVIAIVGHTGAGKSTIVQLLPRLYDPLDGQILIDGQDIREFRLDSLRAQMSMVLQETILFSGSVVENIAYGRTDATWAEILASAKQANAHEFIEKMPQGYYTLLGERGANLSGGQRQRIAIARAFIRNTPILILDEPSTGLDAESTELVLKALRMLMQGKTTVIISHDLNLIRNADHIIVIKSGEIEQVGTHESLLEAGGLYASLYRKQYGGETTDDDAHAHRERKLVPNEISIPNTGSNSNGQGDEMLDVNHTSEMIYLDLPQSPPLLNKLPALATAFKEDAMKALLQPILFGKGDAAYQIVKCTPGKALYLPHNVCNMQFQVKAEKAAGGDILSFIINAHLFPSLPESDHFWSQSLVPLAAQMRSRPEMAPFVNPVGVIENLHMTVSVFPIDGTLPNLTGATNKERMIEIFRNTLPEVLSGSLEIENLRFELAHYGRFQRCVLRYIIEGKPGHDEIPQQKVVYGKLDVDGYGALSIPVMVSLLEQTSRGHNPYYFRIPRSLGFIPDLKLLLMESLSGNNRMKDLIMDRVCGTTLTPPGNLGLEDALEACAHIAASLHGSGIQLGRQRTFEDEAANLITEIQSLEQVFPNLGKQLNTWLEQASTIAAETAPMELCFCHGDFTYSQLIFEGSVGGLVDFDSVCQAEPAVDLGQYLAYQKLVICRNQNPDAPMKNEEIEHLSEVFLNAYLNARGDSVGDPELLYQRVNVYEIISLIRLAVHSWEKLKGERLMHTVKLLKERIACLVQVH